jgi:hypothetical protein
MDEKKILSEYTAPIIEKSQVLVPEKTVIIEEHVEQPSFRYSFDKEPLMAGNVVELIILVDGKEQDRLKTVIIYGPKAGNELRPLLNFDIVEMTAFSKADEDAVFGKL